MTKWPQSHTFRCWGPELVHGLPQAGSPVSALWRAQVLCWQVPGRRLGQVPGRSQDWASSWLPVGIYWMNKRYLWAWRFPPSRWTWTEKFRCRDTALPQPQIPLLAGAKGLWWLRMGKHTLCNRLAKGRLALRFSIFLGGVCTPACTCAHVCAWVCMGVFVCTSV